MKIGINPLLLASALLTTAGVQAETLSYEKFQILGKTVTDSKSFVQARTFNKNYSIEYNLQGESEAEVNQKIASGKLDNCRQANDLQKKIKLDMAKLVVDFLPSPAYEAKERKTPERIEHLRSIRQTIAFGDAVSAAPFYLCSSSSTRAADTSIRVSPVEVSIEPKAGTLYYKKVDIFGSFMTELDGKPVRVMYLRTFNIDHAIIYFSTWQTEQQMTYLADRDLMTQCYEIDKNEWIARFTPMAVQLASLDAPKTDAERKAVADLRIMGKFYGASKHIPNWYVCDKQ